MLEESQKEVSAQRRCAQIRQLNRLKGLIPVCPCGEEPWPCDCVAYGGGRQTAGVEDIVFLEPVYFDGLSQNS